MTASMDGMQRVTRVEELGVNGDPAVNYRRQVYQSNVEGKD